MIENLIHMNGYGLFVWLSFGLVLVSCSLVYLKAKKTLNKYEKEYYVQVDGLITENKIEQLSCTTSISNKLKSKLIAFLMLPKKVKNRILFLALSILITVILVFFILKTLNNNILYFEGHRVLN